MSACCLARFPMLGLLLLGSAACSFGEKTPTLSGSDYKIGVPYEIFGVWYYPHHDPDYDETGIASWYGPGFHGRTTANGEIYDQEALTAAHPTLPMPVLVRVTNLENGRSQVLRINDRGPFVDGRIIDVSRHAAERLGFRRQGTAWVRVQYLEGGPGKDKRPETKVASTSLKSIGGEFFVQAQALREYEYASALRSRLDDYGNAQIDEVVLDDKRLYRVRIGPWKNKETAYDILRQIIALGYATAHIVSVEETILGGAELLASQ